MTAEDDDPLARWLAALETRHLADLRVPEVTRALRALSSAYVERREAGPRSKTRRQVHGALDTTGKRAAFALFYAPLHFMIVSYVIRALGAAEPAPRSIVDLGCGTGVAGAAWALAAGRRSSVIGVERHPWAVEEARWTYRQLGLTGHVRHADVTKLPRVRQSSAVVAGWVLNELSNDERARVEERLMDAAGAGARVLVLEPIARRLVPWWDAAAARVIARGGTADEWRFSVTLPPLLAMFDQAAGLDHRELTARTLYFGERRPDPDQPRSLPLVSRGVSGRAPRS